MARKIIWSLRAQADRKDIFTYWNQRNQSKVYSKKLNRIFKEVAGFLAIHPLVGRSTSLENVRVKVVGPYLIIYEVQAEQIVIHTIRDGRRNPAELNL